MLNKFEEELKSALILQKLKKEDFFDSPLRHGYIIVSIGGSTLYIMDLIRYMHSSEQHIIKVISLTSLKEYDADPKKVSIRKSSEVDPRYTSNLSGIIDTGRMLRIELISTYLGGKEYSNIHSFTLKGPKLRVG